MRSTFDEPTNFESSHALYGWLSNGHSKTEKTMEQKKGQGIYQRVFHWAERSEIPLLATTPEVKTLKKTAWQGLHREIAFVLQRW